MADTPTAATSAAATAPAPARASVPATPSPTDAIVDAWFTESFSNSVVSRDTDVWNAVLQAKDDLKKRLADAA